jgi:NAD+--asparagine ADP-ribosyltransferase
MHLRGNPIITKIGETVQGCCEIVSRRNELEHQQELTTKQKYIAHKSLLREVKKLKLKYDKLIADAKKLNEKIKEQKGHLSRILEIQLLLEPQVDARQEI